MSKNDYRFVDKDPVIDVIRSELQRYGNMNNEQLTRVSFESGVSVTTIKNWLFGDTRRPWSLSTRFVLQALGVTIKYEREDGTMVRESAIQMIPQSEQAKILKAEKARLREHDPEKPKLKKQKDK